MSDDDLDQLAVDYVSGICDGLTAAALNDGGSIGASIAESFRDVVSMLMDCGRLTESIAVCALIECIIYDAASAAASSLARVARAARATRLPTHLNPEDN